MVGWADGSGADSDAGGGGDSSDTDSVEDTELGVGVEDVVGAGGGSGTGGDVGVGEGSGGGRLADAGWQGGESTAFAFGPAVRYKYRCHLRGGLPVPEFIKIKIKRNIHLRVCYVVLHYLLTPNFTALALTTALKSSVPKSTVNK